MEDYDKRVRNEVYSKAIRAGKRTYFIDVKTTRAEDFYLTITESKKRFSNEEGKFFYEKHKLFLYKEDFDKFIDGISEVVGYIKSGNFPDAESEEKKPQAEVPNVESENADTEANI